MKTEFRPPVSLKFDTEKEKDLIEKINGFKSSKQLTYLCEYLLRIVLESPETLRDIGETKDILYRIHELGVTPARYNFFSQVAKEVSDMRDKVDAIYTMAYKTYILAQMGKRLGLTELSENNLRATFLVEKQLADLSKSLGVDNINHTFVGNKVQNTEEMAKEVLEYVIESYDSILSEIKSNLTVTGNVTISGDGHNMTANSQNTNVTGTNVKTSGENIETQKQISEGDEVLDLPEKPVKKAEEKDDVNVISQISGEAADLLGQLMS